MNHIPLFHGVWIATAAMMAQPVLAQTAQLPSMTDIHLVPSDGRTAPADSAADRAAMPPAEVVGIDTEPDADVAAQQDTAESHREILEPIDRIQDERLPQIAQAIAQVTAVQINPTETGVEVLLEVSEGQLAASPSTVFGNALIVDIPNAVLALPDGEEFQAASPAAGIALVTVTPRGEGIRVAITGSDSPPTAEVSTAAPGLVLSVTAGGATDATAADDAIQVVVTATRTEEPLNRIPRSVTVVDREQLEEQSDLSLNLREILGREIPGFSPPNVERITAGFLRGRQPAVLVDGVPLNANGVDRPLLSIDPEAIERIEVVRGPNAVYGAQATGGTINIITRRPTDERLETTVEVGVNAAAGGGDSFLTGESFGNLQRFSVSGNEGIADYTLLFAREQTGSSFDGDGDRIFYGFPLDESQTLNLLGTLGVDLSDEQRIQLSVNHYDNERDGNRYIADLESDEKAEGIETGEQDFIDTPEPFDRTTIANLIYTHGNIFGSQVQAQAYYVDSAGTTSLPFDDRAGFLGAVVNNVREFERWGGRLQIDTPIVDRVSVLWGVDYDNEENFESLDVLDPDAFDASDGQIFRRIDERTYVPAYDVIQLGVFAQLQWDVTDDLLFNGGARYTNFDISAPDYTTFADNRDIEGGSLSFDDVVFNAGAVYQITNELSVFASFAQGFDLPDFSRILRIPPEGFSFEGGFAEVQPVNVDNYELGLRGEWGDLQASLAGFYSYSGLGAGFEEVDGEFILVRTPQRNYGVEAAIDWQPLDRWALGGTLTWQEGDDDFQDDDDFEPTTSFSVSPLKITAYVENQTTPGWRNRLQLLFSGDRDRAFDAGVDSVPIDSYLVLDLISSIQIGGGTLNIGVQNLLDNQYLSVYSQAYRGFDPTLAPAARGRTVTVNYRISF